MEQEYLIDTNVVIDYLDNKLPDPGATLIDNIEINLSVITRIELLSWPRATPVQLNILEDFIEKVTLFPLGESLILKTIEIRRIYNTKLPDSIIAATALVSNFKLITRNLSDFKNIPGLDLLNPWDL